MIGNGLCLNVWMLFKNCFVIEDIVEFYVVFDGNIGFINFFNFDNIVGFFFMDWVLVEYDKEKEELVCGLDGFMIKVEKGG